MPALTLAEIKTFLRVDNDAEDALLTAQISAAQSFIGGKISKTKHLAGYGDNSEPAYKEISSDELYKHAVKLLVAHWYENRVVETVGNKTINKISYTVDAILTHIETCGDYV